MSAQSPQSPVSAHEVGEKRIEEIRASLGRGTDGRWFAPSDIAFLLEQLASVPDQIQAAVKAERESCMKALAAKYLGDDHRRDERDDCYDLAITDSIAAIRSRSEVAK